MAGLRRHDWIFGPWHPYLVDCFQLLRSLLLLPFQDWLQPSAVAPPVFAPCSEGREARMNERKRRPAHKRQERSFLPTHVRDSPGDSRKVKIRLERRCSCFHCYCCCCCCRPTLPPTTTPS